MQEGKQFFYQILSSAQPLLFVLVFHKPLWYVFFMLNKLEKFIQFQPVPAKFCFLQNLLFFIFCLLIGAGLGAFLHFEIDWDFANYHYYNPWAFFHQRLGYDIAPASLHTYFNPLLDIPFYLLVLSLNEHPLLVSALQGLYFGILIFIFSKICFLFFRLEKCKYPLWWAVYACLIAATGFAVFSQISTTTNEMQLAVLVLAAFYFLFKNICLTKQNTPWPFVFSGLCLGCAAGLKLTAAIYGLSSFLLLCLFFHQLRNPAYKIGLFCLAGICGFLICNGWWMWKMWTLFQNPLFPFFNEIFRSEYYESFNFFDKRYLPQSLFEYLSYPFIWAVSLTDMRVDDAQFIDFRFALAYIIVVFFLLQRFLRIEPFLSILNLS